MERKISEVRYGNIFLKHAFRLPKKIIKKAGEKEQAFKENAFHPTLHTHKLHGKEQGSWAFWIDYDYRIKFIFLSENEVLFLDIGTHNIYK